MNKRAILAIARKDLKVVLQSKPVTIPIIIIPAVMFIVMPAVFALIPSAMGEMGSQKGQLDLFLHQMPAALQAEVAGYTDTQKMVVMGLLYFLAPLYLIVPLMVASVIAADSFAGEKERKTLEPLLYTPTTDGELFLGKMLSAWIPAVAVGLGGFVLYGLVCNVAAWPVVGRIFFPNPMWLALAFWVGPAAAGLGLGASVLVSARATTFQEAYQVGSIVVLPVLALVLGQAAGVMYLSGELVLLLGLVLWILDGALLWFGARTFRRAEVIARL